MIIYNSKEMPTSYMQKDEIIVEIRSLYSPEELLTKLRAGEEISEDELRVDAFAVGNGEMITQDEFVPTKEMEGSDVLSSEELEEREASVATGREKLFQAYEAFVFNNPWRGFVFERTQLSKEELTKQLYCALGIMPTIANIPDKSVQELKKMSSLGDRLYWNFAGISSNNLLPGRNDIEFYDSLNDIEKRIINESGVHPMKMLSLARIIKDGDPGRVLNVDMESIMHLVHSGIANEQALGSCVKSVGMHGYSGPLSTKNYQFRGIPLHDKAVAAVFEDWMYSMTSVNNVTKISQVGNLMANIRSLFFEAVHQVHDENEKQFAEAMFSASVVPFRPEDEKAIFEGSANANSVVDHIIEDYKKLYAEDFVPKHTDENGNFRLETEEVEKYAKKNSAQYEMKSEMMKKAEEIFKELYHGHAPKVMRDYILAQLEYRWLNSQSAVKDETLRDIAEKFNQKNIQKVAKYKSPALFALSEEINYGEIKEEHINLFASMIPVRMLKELKDKEFSNWYATHKDTNTSELADLLNPNIVMELRKFDPSLNAKELVMSIKNRRGIEDSKAMEAKYGYKFADNEIAIRGRHVVATQGKLKMYMLDADDYRNFTIGYDTHCCQHYGNAGESCVYKYTTDPFAAAVVIERDGRVLAQGFVWTDEVADTLVFDNMEFENDRNVGQFSDIIAAWCKAMPYRNIHVGTGYNQSMLGWGKKVTYQAVLPTTLDNSRRTSWGNGNCYSDYHPDARAVKKDGNMLISEKVPVRIASKPDEPTKWDVLARPETAFMLNDCSSSIENRLEFARKFLEEQTPEIQMEAVKRNINSIRYIDHPTEEVQNYVVEKDKNLLSFIHNPCASVQALILRNDPSYIRQIENPSEEICLDVVRRDGMLLKFIQNPSREVVETAVKASGYAIMDVPAAMRTDELWRMAIENNPRVVSLYGGSSDGVLQFAVSKDPKVVEIIEHPSETVQMIAVRKDPSTILSIKNPAYNAIREAVSRNGLLVRNFAWTYPQLRSVALRQNGFVINVLKNPTIEEYNIAVNQNPLVARGIKDSTLRQEIEERLREDSELERD